MKNTATAPSSRRLVEMFDLDTIKKMNSPENTQRKPEDNFSRQCSFSGDEKTGVVLHSALHRNTAFLSPDKVPTFMAAWNAAPTQEEKNAVVERYFTDMGESVDPETLSPEEVVDQLIQGDSK